MDYQWYHNYHLIFQVKDLSVTIKCLQQWHAPMCMAKMLSGGFYVNNMSQVPHYLPVVKHSMQWLAKVSGWLNGCITSQMSHCILIVIPPPD